MSRQDLHVRMNSDGPRIKLGLVARSRVMQALLAEIKRFAAADANTLITGETGAGKDMVARALHAYGPRRHQPFVAIDCPSLPTTLLESELFGHERGAFTDATTSRAGRFEVAGRGTVYLDRVSELPLDMQPKLLRLVEEKRGERLGGTTPFAVQARIISSVEPDIEARVHNGSFRRDLYHRLMVLLLVVPPLRERVSDILPLAKIFLRESSRRLGRTTPALTRAAAAALKAHPWVGNVRELRHAIERAVIDTPGDRIDAGDLPLELPANPEARFGSPLDRPTLDTLERQYIDLVLRQTRQNQTRAAAILGISRKALWEKRKRYGLE